MIQFRRYRLVFPVLVTGLLAFAQDDLFTTVSSQDTSGLFTTVSSAAAEPSPSKPVAPAPVSGSPTAVAPASAVVSPAIEPAPAPDRDTVGKKSDDEWEQDLLRDPFWPVGFFPDGWQKQKVSGRGTADDTGWKAASAKLKISGTSTLGGRTVAIVNGQLKGVGDTVEVLSGGSLYQWQIVGITAGGQIQLKKTGIR